MTLEAPPAVQVSWTNSSGATVLQVARGGREKGAPAGTCKLVKANCGS
jgi:hypothetical protein